MDKGNLITEFRSIVNNHPDLSLGQIIYSITQTLVKKEGFNELLNVSDRDMYKMIQKANERLTDECIYEDCGQQFENK